MSNKLRASVGDVDYEQLQNRIFKRVHRTGEEMKNDLPNALRMAITAKAWRHFTNPKTGRPFAGLDDWLHHELPQGVAMGMGRHAITYREVMELCRDAAPDVYSALAESAPKGRRPKGHVNGNGAELGATSSGSTRPHLSNRLAREHPEVWRGYLAGHYRSIRAAAEAAGLVRPGHDPLMRLKSYWRRADSRTRREFLKWIETEDAQRRSSSR